MAKRKHLGAVGERGRQAMAEKRTAQASDTAFDDLYDELSDARSHIKELELALQEKDNKCIQLQHSLEKAKAKLLKLEAEAALWKLKHKNTYRELRTQRQKVNRGQERLDQLEVQVAMLKKAEEEATALYEKEEKQSNRALELLQKENKGLQSELSTSLGKWTSELETSRSKLAGSFSKIKNLTKEHSHLQKSLARSKKSKEKAIAAVKDKLTKQLSVHHVKSKGVITEDTRNVVRILVNAGCSRNYISEVIYTVLKSAGITTVGTITRPSIT